MTEQELAMIRLQALGQLSDKNRSPFYREKGSLSDTEDSSPYNKSSSPPPLDDRLTRLYQQAGSVSAQEEQALGEQDRLNRLYDQAGSLSAEEQREMEDEDFRNLRR